MNETDNARLFVRDWQDAEPSLFAYKIPTAPYSPNSIRCNRCGLENRSGKFRFTAKTAIDSFFSLHGMFIGIEWKLTLAISIANNSVRPEQLEQLQAIESSGGLALIGIFQIQDDSQRIYFFTVESWLQCITEAQGKSFRFSEVGATAFHRTKGTHGKLTWQIPPFGEWIKHFKKQEHANADAGTIHSQIG